MIAIDPSQPIDVRVATLESAVLELQGIVQAFPAQLAAATQATAQTAVEHRAFRQAILLQIAGPLAAKLTSTTPPTTLTPAMQTAIQAFVDGLIGVVGP